MRKSRMILVGWMSLIAFAILIQGCKKEEEPPQSPEADESPQVTKKERKHKTREEWIYKHLDDQYKGVVKYFEENKKLPPSMKAPICPGDMTIETIGKDEFAQIPDEIFKEGAKGRLYVLIGAPPYGSDACYQFTTKYSEKAPEEGLAFTLHAWTDLNHNGTIAHWQKVGVYRADAETFQAGFAHRKPETDK